GVLAARCDVHQLRGRALDQLLAQRAGEAFQRALRDALAARHQLGRGAENHGAAACPQRTQSRLEERVHLAQLGRVGDAGGVEDQRAVLGALGAVRLVAHVDARRGDLLGDHLGQPATRRAADNCGTGEGRLPGLVAPQRSRLGEPEPRGEPLAHRGLGEPLIFVSHDVLPPGWFPDWRAVSHSLTYSRVGYDRYHEDETQGATMATSSKASSKTGGSGASRRTIRKVAVVGANRIPFARSNGPYATASNQDMLTAALNGLVGRFGLAGERIGEFAAGAVLKHSRDFNLARETVLGSALSPETPASDVQMACGTGLQAIINVANKIALGQIDSAIAGGVDTTSDAPLAVNDDLRRLLIQLNSAKTPAQRLKLLAKLRPGHIVPDIPRNAEPRTGLSMGEHAALTAKAWGITREEQDE